MNFINTIDDLFNMLDRYTEGVIGIPFILSGISRPHF